MYIDYVKYGFTCNEDKFDIEAWSRVTAANLQC